MAHSQSEIDQDLNVIFDSCSKEGQNEAPVVLLASLCVEKYAPERLDLKEIILDRLDPTGEEDCISRSDFISKLKCWMLESNSSAVEEDKSFQFVQNSSSDFSVRSDECVIYASTPLNPRSKYNPGFVYEDSFQAKAYCVPFDFLDSLPDLEKCTSCHLDLSRERQAFNDKTGLLQNCLAESEEKFFAMRKVNASLETKFSLSEQKNQSLESQIEKLNNKINSYEREKRQFALLLNDMEEQLVTSNQKCTELASENSRLKSDLRKCQCKDLREKSMEFQQECEFIERRLSSEIRDKDSKIVSLENDLKAFKEYEEVCVKRILSLKQENEALVSNQGELLSTIDVLRNEKQSLQEQIQEAKALESVNFPVVDKIDHIKGKNGISDVPSFCGNMIPGTLEEEICMEYNQRFDSVDIMVQTDWDVHFGKRHGAVDICVQTDDTVWKVLERNDTADFGVQTQASFIRIDAVDISVQTDDTGWNVLERNDVDITVQTDDTGWNILKRNDRADICVQAEVPFMRNDLVDSSVQVVDVDKTRGHDSIGWLGRVRPFYFYIFGPWTAALQPYGHRIPVNFTFQWLSPVIALGSSTSFASNSPVKIMTVSAAYFVQILEAFQSYTSIQNDWISYRPDSLLLGSLFLIVLLLRRLVASVAVTVILVLFLLYIFGTPVLEYRHTGPTPS